MTSWFEGITFFSQKDLEDIDKMNDRDYPIVKLKKRRRDGTRNYTTKINKYFITLTSSSANKDPNEYYTAIKNILKQKALKITYGYGVIELTKNANPHAHIYMECKGYCRLAFLKRQWTSTSIDIRRVIKDNGIRNYQNKDENNDKLNTYLSDHQCPRTYSLEGI